jgi:hypothetical protein
LKISNEAVGVHCGVAGNKLEVGVDNGDGGGTAGNGMLEAGEVDEIAYVCTPSKKVFLSATTYTGANLMSVANATAICAADAAAESLSGTYLPWLSTSFSDNPGTTFTKSTSAYVLVDGTVVANGWVDLTDLTIDNKINRTADGTVIADGAFIWSGTAEDGTPTFSSCIGWTSSSGGDNGSHGVVGATDSNWSNAGPLACDTPAYVLCFEQ